MSVKLYEIINKIETKYPLSLSEDYDNSGLSIGDKNSDIDKILICLDITEDVIDEAALADINLIISHHPLIFKPLKCISVDDTISRIAVKAIKNNINVYSIHTNFDNGIDGMNDLISSKLSLENTQPLLSNKPIALYKFVVYVPESHHEIVRHAIFEAGGGYIGQYSHCSFNIDGKGTFMPHEGTNPFIGTKNSLETVKEVRIETILKEEDIQGVIEKVLEVHPYEEVAYDVYPLKNEIKSGSGRCGVLQNPMSFKEFTEYVKKNLNIPYLKVSGDMNRIIKRVGIVGGSGADFIKAAAKNKCDVLITGDVKHHNAIDANNLGINIIDGSHYYTEIVFIDYIKEFLDGMGINVNVSNINTNPFIQV